MALATGQKVSFYGSLDLLGTWEHLSDFGEDQGAHETHPWECPDLFQMTTSDGEETETAWVLIVGIGVPEDKPFGSFTQYFIGNFDSTNFTNKNSPETILLLDEGRDYYATQTWCVEHS